MKRSFVKAAVALALVASFAAAPLAASAQVVTGTVTANAGTGTFTVNGTVTVSSGTVTANAGTGTFTVAGTVTANTGTGFPALSSTAWLVTMGGSSYQTYAGATSTVLVVKASPGRLDRFINTNTGAQPGTLTCFDSASLASGTVLYAAVLGASQVVDIQIQAVNGITCQASAATLAGNGINITFN